MITLLGAVGPMTISPPEAYRPRTLVGFDIGSAGFGGVWYWMLPAIPIDPEAATVVCSFCCRVPLTPLMFPWTKIMLALRSPGPGQLRDRGGDLRGGHSAHVRRAPPDRHALLAERGVRKRHGGRSQREVCRRRDLRVGVRRHERRVDPVPPHDVLGVGQLDRSAA